MQYEVEIAELRARVQALESRVQNLEVQVEMLKIQKGFAGSEPPTDEATGYFVLPVNSLSAIFKGKKVKSVILPNGQELEVKTWKEAATAILMDCNSDEGSHNMLLKMVGKVGGRNRVLLGKTPKGMNAPLKIDEGIYFESKFDTESLLNVLKNLILIPAGYDFSAVMLKCKG